jgi:predicted secreted protein
MSGCQWLGAKSQESHIKWAVATTAGAPTPPHLDRSAVVIIILAGSKKWYIARHRNGHQGMDKISAFDNWGPFSSCIKDYTWEGAYLMAGDVLCVFFSGLQLLR